MSSTPSPDSQLPPSPSYPDADGPLGHRWGAGAIALAVAVVVAVIAVVAALVAWNRGPVETEPPSSLDPLVTSMGNAPALSLLNAPSGLSFMAAPRGSVDFGQGVSLTPVEGWTVEAQDENWVTLFSPDKTALMFVIVGEVKPSSIERLLNADIASRTTDLIQNLQLGEIGEIEELNSPNFTQALQVDYAGDVITEQGSLSLRGVFVELYNPQTRNSAFIDLAAIDEEALVAAWRSAAKRMINSMF